MLLKGECIEVMKAIKPNSVDAIVTDPPYFLEFMNKKWDKADLIEPSFGYWLSGFVDGEGCFRIHRVRNGDYYETHFCINLRRDDKAILENIKNILGFGRVQDRKGGNGSKPQISYIVNKREDCFKLAELFLRFPLKAKKQRDFFKWCEALIAWKNQRKGNRWHGKPDVSEMEKCWLEMKEVRKYQEKPMPVNKEEFMHRLWLTEAYRVLKPGGSILVMGGTRTFHRVACAVEDSGFIIKDTLMWIYGSGFPKCQDITPMIDGKLLGITTKQVKERREKIGMNPNHRGKSQYRNQFTKKLGQDGSISIPLTDLAKHWDGFKVGGIKPAYEPIIWAVKPPKGSYVDNVLKWEVGAVNVDETRISTSEKEVNARKDKGNKLENHPSQVLSTKEGTSWNGNKGRFPANIILSHHPECVQVGVKKMRTKSGGKPTMHNGSPFKQGERLKIIQPHHHNPNGYEQVESWDCHPDCAVRILDEQSGDRLGSHPQKTLSGYKGDCHLKFAARKNREIGFNDSGGASRFFYCAKASRGERNAGLEGMEEKLFGQSGGATQALKEGKSEYIQKDHIGLNKIKIVKNNHPTVKPIKLFEWLIKLITREGHIVLDPFIGSGTTIIAAHNTGRKCVGIEKEEEYIEIAKRRRAHWRSRPRQLEII